MIYLIIWPQDQRRWVRRSDEILALSTRPKKSAKGGGYHDNQAERKKLRRTAFTYTPESGKSCTVSCNFLKNFLKMGVGVQKIGREGEKSMEYVKRRSI